MALFLLSLARTALVTLPTAHFVTLRPPFPFRHAQFVQVFPLKPAPFCNLSAGIGITNKSAIYFLFSFSPTLTLPLPLCPLPGLSCYLKLSGRNCFLFPLVLSDYNRSPDRHFSRRKTEMMRWPDRERCSCSLQTLVVSLHSPLVSTFVFSRTGGALSHLNSLTLRFPRFLLKNFALSSSLQRTQSSVKLLSL